MKRSFIVAVASLALVAVLSACSSKPAPAPTPAPATPAAPSAQPAPAASQTPTLDKIKKDGKLSIGTSPDYPPFESLDKQNNVIGFDVDIMQAVADKLGVKLNVVQMGFDNLIAGLNAKQFDIMAAGVSVTDERKKSVDFSNPYLLGNDAVVVYKDNNDKIAKLEDLVGKTVAVQIGTVQADNLKKIQGINVKEYNLFTEAAAAVSSKQAYAMYLHSAVANAFVKADPNLKVAFLLKSADTAYALRKDTPDLTAFVNTTLDDMKKNGKFDELLSKWFK